MGRWHEDTPRILPKEPRCGRDSASVLKEVRESHGNEGPPREVVGRRHWTSCLLLASSPNAQRQSPTLQRLPSRHVHTQAVTTRDVFPTPTTRGLSGSSEQAPSPLRCFLGQLAACRLVPSCVGLRLVRCYTASLLHLSSIILPHCVTQPTNRYRHWARSGHHGCEWDSRRHS